VHCYLLLNTVWWVLQLLWVNLIMDTMGALALATEDPNPTLLNDKVGTCAAVAPYRPAFLSWLCDLFASVTSLRSLRACACA
jgi:magnesium-transporting ATPase (P-type)